MTRQRTINSKQLKFLTWLKESKGHVLTKLEMAQVRYVQKHHSYWTDTTCHKILINLRKHYQVEYQISEFGNTIVR